MPMVGNKKFPYTPKGKKAAKEYAGKMKAPPMKSAPMKKQAKK